MSQKPLSILISGAGVAGSTLALTLARNPSFNPKPLITLIERATEPRTTGQAVDIRGPGVDVIRKLGLEEKIKQRHTKEVGVGIVNQKGVTIATFNATGDSKNQAATSEYEILRGELAELLLEEVDKAREEGANVNVVYGESIESLKEEDDGVAVKFSHGKLEAQKFDVVLVADGMMSRTRAMIFEQYKSMEKEDFVKVSLSTYELVKLAHTDVSEQAHGMVPCVLHYSPRRAGRGSLEVVSCAWRLMYTYATTSQQEDHGGLPIHRLSEERAYPGDGRIAD
jgi:2-polyprenyl-6-methoxyphenol hydroxylase-like FAD-dependent oxidoreductase